MRDTTLLEVTDMRRYGFAMWSAAIAGLMFQLVLCDDRHDRPLYINCTSTAECAQDECCMLGMNRFSVPMCTKMRGEGEQCRPYNAPTSTTVYYPGGTEVQLVNVYMSLCGCADGLTCGRASGTCELE